MIHIHHTHEVVHTVGEEHTVTTLLTMVVCSDCFALNYVLIFLNTTRVNKNVNTAETK